MLPRRAKIAFCACVAACACVWWNVMYLQQGTRADILARTQRLGESTARLAPRAEPWTTSGRETTAATSADPAAPDPAVVREIQRQLADRGYRPGPADGSVHPVTRAAVMAYEHDHGMALTGEPTEELLKAILFGLPGTGITTAGDHPPQVQEIVRSVQKSLAALGYRITKIDGRLGEETAQAIRAFETQHRMTPSGRISGGLLQELEKAVARL